MPLLLIELIGGRTVLDDTVEIAIIEHYDLEIASTRRFWHIYSSAPIDPRLRSGNSAEMIFEEASVPRVVRQLYAILIWRGAQTRYDAEEDKYRLLGPHLCRYSQTPEGGPRLFIVGDYDPTSFLASFEPMPQMTAPGALAEMWPHFQWIFNIFNEDYYRPMIRLYRLARRWRQIAAAAPKKRALARTDAIREELIAVAWHPRRFREWCLDSDEQRELSEWFGGGGAR